MSMKDKKTGVLMGGFGSEREVSFKSGEAVLDSLRESGYDAVAIDVRKDLVERLKAERVEVAFLALHGPLGEDGVVQGLLEFLGIPYTGSGVLASALAFDKRVSKRVFKMSGIPTARWEELRMEKGGANGADESPRPVNIKPPLVIKPSRQGSTVGITVIMDDDEKSLKEALDSAFELDEWVIAEEYVPGREITVGLLDGEALGCLEIRPLGGFYDYEHKYTPGGAEYIAPAPIGEELTQKARSFALEAYDALCCSGAARADFRLKDDGTMKILEINTIPGLTATSLLPKSAALMGVSFDMLVEKMLAGACLRAPLPDERRERADTGDHG